jgi:hypothetical protein
MDVDRLREHLHQLHRELSGIERLDARSSDLLGQVREDIRRLLGEPEPGQGLPPSAAVPGRLERLAVGFEAEHPTLAESLRRLIDLLSKAGV